VTLEIVKNVFLRIVTLNFTSKQAPFNPKIHENFRPKTNTANTRGKLFEKDAETMQWRQTNCHPQTLLSVSSSLTSIATKRTAVDLLCLSHEYFGLQKD
jgi:hypothetical protein